MNKCRHTIEPNLRILRTDVSGMPIEWVGFEDAVRLHCLDQILYPMGSPLYTVRGGINAKWGISLQRLAADLEHYAPVFGFWHT